MKRNPCVAGQFYPGEPGRLRKEIDGFSVSGAEKKPVKGVLSPHAGYVYSGKVAADVFSRIEAPDTFILLGPNHTGLGEDFALWDKGTWGTPLGEVEVDEKLAEEILADSSLIKPDYRAHLHEHSIEVQLPFIQYFAGSAKIVPLALMRGTFGELEKISRTITEAIQKTGKKVVIAASSDMSHYLPRKAAEKLDKIALEPLLKLEARRFFDTVVKNNISMCGFLPATVMILVCKALGSKKGEMVMYTTSGETSGDYFQVVGYAGALFA